MTLIQCIHPWLAGAGGLLLPVGIIIRRMIAGWDLSGIATETAWQLVRGKRTAETPTAFEAKIREIAADGTATGAGRRAAGVAVRHVLAQVLGIASWITILAGCALVAAAVLWK